MFAGNSYSDSILPFYASPAARKSSIEIIKEARASIKPVKTKRPYTPLDSRRQLFRKTSRSLYSPSIVSIDCTSSDGEPRPLSAIRLSPLKTRSSLNEIPEVSLGCSNNSAKSVFSANLKQYLESGTRHKTNKNSSNESNYSKSLPKQPLFYKRNAERTNLKNNIAPEKEEYKERSRSACSTSSRRESQNTLTESFLYHINPIIIKLNRSSGLSGSTLIALTKDLYIAMNSNNLFTKAFPERSLILRCLFRLLDQYDTQLLLQLSRIILAMKVSGNNLTSLCKLIYKVSRNEANDNLFLEDNFLDLFTETLCNVKVFDQRDVVLYCVSTIKFLAGNSLILPRLFALNIIRILTEKLSQVNNEVENNSTSYGYQLLVEMAATMRNLSDFNDCLPSFLANNTLCEMFKILNLNMEDYDAVKNSCRFFSKITVMEKCCFETMKNELVLDTFLHIIKFHENKMDVVVRMCFVLGNLTAYVDEARLQLFKCTESLNLLLAVADVYGENKNVNGTTETIRGENISGAEDILIKVFRIFANMSIHSDVGVLMAKNETLLNRLLLTLGERTTGELTLCILSTLNNLSYYCYERDVAILYEEQATKLISYLIEVLRYPYIDNIIEAMRVLGNLSQSKVIRNKFASTSGVQQIVNFLDSDNTDIIYLSCGVLVNLMLDECNKNTFLQNSGLIKLLEVLQDYGTIDWSLCSLVCQTIWNFIAGIDNLVSVVGEATIEDFVKIFEDYLESNGMFSDDKEVAKRSQEDKETQWENQFCPVARDILNILVNTLNDADYDLVCK